MTVSTDVSKYMGNAVSLASIWGSILYNVKATPYNSKGDGSDDTNAIQKAINAAIAANASTVFFPPGTYSASSLTNLNKVVLLGNSATLTVGGIDVPINQLGGSSFNIASDFLTKTINKMQLGLAVKIVCYGDSITYGDNGTGAQTANPYPQTLQSRLRTVYGNNNITVVNNGTNGQQSDEALANFDSVVVPQNPDLVIIMYGINDISGYVAPTNTIDVYKKDIAGMVEKCIGNRFGVLLMTPTFTLMPNLSNSKIANYGQTLIELAKRYSVPYIDMQKVQQEIYFNGSISPGNLMVDAAHFTDAGYQLLADAVLQKALDVNMDNSINVRTNEVMSVPAVISKYIKTDSTSVNNNGLQFGYLNYSLLKDGTRGTFLSFEFYVNKTGMDLFLVSPLVNQGGKLTVVDNGVNLPNTINFYAEESVVYDGQNLVYENIPLGYHKLEFNITNLASGDATVSPSNPIMYFSYFQFRPTEVVPNTLDIRKAIGGVTFSTIEKFIPILGGGVRYDSANATNDLILLSGKSAQLKNGKTFVLEFDGYLFDKFGVSWFGNKAGNSNLVGYNTGMLLVFNTTTINLYQSAVNDAVNTFTDSTVSHTLDFTLPHRVRIEQTYAGLINIYIDGVLKITCTSTRFKTGYFGFYNQAVTGQSARLSRFEYAYY